MSISSWKLGVRGLESLLRKLVFGTLTVLGAGYAVANMAMFVVLSYSLSQFTISSVQIATIICGVLLFLLAAVIIIAVGVLFIIGGTRYYGGDVPKRIVVLSVLLASFYLLCLGIGSVLLISEVNISVLLLTVSSMFFMVGTSSYVLRSFRFKLVGSILGILGGILFAFAVSSFQIFGLALAGWEVPFLGPFMSMAIVEGPAIVLGSLGLFVHSILTESKEGPMTYIFFPMATLVYGIGMFIGPLILSFSFLDLLWKSPWAGPLYNVPSWLHGTMIFWSAGLVMLVIGGILLIISSYIGFFYAWSTLEE